MTPPVVLTIAGSDAGGGAGIQADLRTFAAHGVLGACAVTAITAQNTVEVRRVEQLAANLVVDQIEAVLDDLPVAAVKTGMLGNGAVVEAVAALADAGRLPNLVVDPVLVASSGAPLLAEAATGVVVERLLPRATVVTPNVDEAAALLGRPVESIAERREAVRALGEAGAAFVVLTGGGTGRRCTDLVWDGARLTELRAPRVATPNTHGTGCTFAAAIAARLAHGVPPLDAITAAKAYVHLALEAGRRHRIGRGPGPLEHFFDLDKEDSR